MSWSFSLGKVAGSDIRVHLTFFILLAWIAIAHAGEGANAALEGVVFIIAVFACVVLHELGHAIAARRYGIRTPDITLLPIGGVARLERFPEKPSEEIFIALAGPAVNVVIAAILILILGALPDLATVENIEDPNFGFLARLAGVNIFLVVFNLIPAFPMDGGRVLRAVLAISKGRVAATQTAAKVGQAIAFLFGFLGLMSNPILIFIAIFVYLAASAEAEMTTLMDVADHMTVEEAMITSFESLGTQSTVEDAGQALIRTTQHEFPVVDGAGRFRGMLIRSAMVTAMEGSGPLTPVMNVMVQLPEVSPNTPLRGALDDMNRDALPGFVVTDAESRLSGYVTRENIAEIMMLHNARQA